MNYGARNEICKGPAARILVVILSTIVSVCVLIAPLTIPMMSTNRAREKVTAALGMSPFTIASNSLRPERQFLTMS